MLRLIAKEKFLLEKDNNTWPKSWSIINMLEALVKYWRTASTTDSAQYLPQKYEWNARLDELERYRQNGSDSHESMDQNLIPYTMGFLLPWKRPSKNEVDHKKARNIIKCHASCIKKRRFQNKICLCTFLGNFSNKSKIPSSTPLSGNFSTI